MNYWNKEINNISNWMKEYLENSGCKGYICGISGGIDSALASYLAIKAVDESKKFIGMYLPCQSSPDSKSDAIQLAENLGIELRVFNLIDSYNAIIKELEAGGETVSRLTMANTKARLRMTMLFAIANQYNYLVTGTSNKSELNIGYCTVGGDQTVSIEPLGNYYKSEIYQMVELIPEIPKNILTKKPSADLWEGQTDEEEIGMSYIELDKILKILDRGKSKEVFSEKLWEKINKVQKMIKKAYYKNNLPPKYERK